MLTERAIEEAGGDEKPLFEMMRLINAKSPTRGRFLMFVGGRFLIFIYISTRNLSGVSLVFCSRARLRPSIRRRRRRRLAARLRNKPTQQQQRRTFAPVARTPMRSLGRRYRRSIAHEHPVN